MDDFEIRVHDFKAFGELIKDWSNQKEAIPTKVGQLKTRLQVGNIATIGNGYDENDDVEIFRPTHRRVSLLIPDAADLAPLPKGKDYPLPSFYSAVFEDLDPDIPTNEKENFRSRRIADYAMRKCV